MKLRRSGNTTNLLKHLKCKHPQQHEECLKEIDDKKKSKKSKTEASYSSAQLTLQKTFEKGSFYPKGFSEKEKD